MAQLKSSTTIDGVLLLDYVYPIGSMYMTTDDTFDPRTTWGGNWEKLEGYFLRGTTGDDYPNAGMTGGQDQVTLTTSEMPAHVHRQYVTANYGGTGTRMDYNSDHSGLQKYDQGIDTGSSGGGQPHENRPRFYSINMWIRTA